MSFNKDNIVKFSGLQLIKMSRWNIGIKNQRIYSYVSTYFGKENCLNGNIIRHIVCMRQHLRYTNFWSDNKIVLLLLG